MDPADTGSLRRALAFQGATVGHLDSLLREVTDNLRTLTSSESHFTGQMDQAPPIPLSLRLSGNHHESVKLLIIPSPQAPVVLGQPWLKLHKPHIDWSAESVSSRSTFCHSHCLQSAPAPTKSAGAPTIEAPDLTLVPAT